MNFAPRSLSRVLRNRCCRGNVDENATWIRVAVDLTCAPIRIMSLWNVSKFTPRLDAARAIQSRL